MIDAEWWEYDSAEELAEAVAGDAQFVIESALDARGDAVVAFAGGRTPAAAQALLAKARLKWKNVTIVPTDDRLVPVQDERSNVRALAERFLPLGARVIPLTGGDLPVEATGKAADARLQAVH
jgi:6-phosphogluconolactonase